MKNYYKILGLDNNCSATDVKKAYRRLSKKYHPDVNNGNKSFEERFKGINEAYAVLSNAEKRKMYDFQFFRYNAAKNSASSYTAQTSYNSNKEQGKSTGYSTTEQKAPTKEENISGNGAEWSQLMAMLRVIMGSIMLYMSFVHKENVYDQYAYSSFYKEASSALSELDTVQLGREPVDDLNDTIGAGVRSNSINDTKYIYLILKTEKPTLVRLEGSPINDSMSGTTTKSMDIDSVRWVRQNYGSSVEVIENFNEKKKNKITDQLVKDLLYDVALEDQNFHENVSTKVADENKKKEFLYYESNVVGVKCHVFDTYKEASKFKNKNK